MPVWDKHLSEVGRRELLGVQNQRLLRAPLVVFVGVVWIGLPFFKEGHQKSPPTSVVARHVRVSGTIASQILERHLRFIVNAPSCFT